MTQDRTPTLLDDFYVGERDDITFPCARSLKPGETISTVLITSQWESGEPDAAADQIVSTPYQVIDNDVVQRLIGMLPGTWYLVRGEVRLNSGRRLVGLARVYAKNK